MALRGRLGTEILFDASNLAVLGSNLSAVQCVNGANTQLNYSRGIKFGPLCVWGGGITQR